MFVFQLAGINLTVVNASPSVEDVSQYKGDKDRNVGHDFERKPAGATVGQRQRTLQVGTGWIIGRIIIAYRQ